MEYEKAPYTGLSWPDSTSFKRLFEATVETCEKYEAGEFTGDEAADIVFNALNTCDVVNTPFGWHHEEKRFFAPTSREMMNFVWWASTQAPDDIRQLGRALLAGMFKSALRGKKAA